MIGELLLASGLSRRVIVKISLIGHCVLRDVSKFSNSVPTCPGSSRASSCSGSSSGKLLKKLFVVEGCWRCFVVVDVEVASAAAGT